MAPGRGSRPPRSARAARQDRKVVKIPARTRARAARTEGTERRPSSGFACSHWPARTTTMTARKTPATTSRTGVRQRPPGGGAGTPSVVGCSAMRSGTVTAHTLPHRAGGDRPAGRGGARAQPARRVVRRQSGGPQPEGLTDRSDGYQAPMTHRQEAASTDRDAPRVLVVDDAPAIRHALRGVLEDAGIDVVGEAPDGVEGVALADSLRPDVVLMDLRMPAADGFQATARIVQDLPEVRVVVLSAYESDESTEAVLAAGAYAFLPKDCDADRIRDVVVAAWRS